MYRWYVLGLLTLVFTWNLLDRGLLTLTLEPIKHELQLSDTQLGFLTGISFALFYATAGLPIARWADRGNRVTIASLAMALWGVTVMGSLLVTSFTQLVAARVAAAVGESGCMPPTYSLVGDYFPRPVERTRAMTIYFLASPISHLIAFLGGGILYREFGWRLAFFFIGIPGLIIALLVRTTISEPRAQQATQANIGGGSRRLSQVASVLWTKRSLRHLSIAMIVVLTLSLGMQPWYAAFLVRSHGMRIADLGVALGLIFGVCGVAGVSLGGYASTRWFKDNERAHMRLSAMMTALLSPCFAFFLLVPRPSFSLGGLVPLVVVFNFFVGPSFSLMQRLVPEWGRASSLSLVMLLTNLIGMGLGPQIVGILSDRLYPLLGVDSLRYAMLVMSGLALWAAYHFWRAGETVTRDLAHTAATESDAPYVAVAQSSS